jgi:23S rRNA (uracil747-C5)-methyltransferase
VDLRDCALHTHGIQTALPVLADFLRTAKLTPYDVSSRRGELKHLLVTESPDGELMVRFVLRSTEAIPRTRKHLPGLLQALPNARVVSVNLQPVHKAVLEGPTELLLTEQQSLPMRVNGLTLHLRPRGFFQTNTGIAAALYRLAADWADEVSPRSVVDLYCGVGGFALHLARPGRSVVGVEVSEEAVVSARTAAREAGLDARFEVGDASGWSMPADTPDETPDLVVVNPPRRGLGPELSRQLEDSGAGHVLYSSCRAETLARDLAAMPSLRPRRAVLLDMFPHTDHYEVLVLLARS